MTYFAITTNGTINNREQALIINDIDTKIF